MSERYKEKRKKRNGRRVSVDEPDTNCRRQPPPVVVVTVACAALGCKKIRAVPPTKERSSVEAAARARQ